MNNSTVSSSRPPSYDAQDIDFAELARNDPDFAAVCKGRTVDFGDPQAVQQLTKSLLKRDFNLVLQLPNDRLCPPVPVRYNYVHWIQSLLDTTSDSYTDRYDPAREVLGLDIGVGASCIYPLLACAASPKWRMAGTDIDQHSLDYARRNVEANQLGHRIRLALSTTDSPLIPLAALKLEGLDFVMCNPPFFPSLAAMRAGTESKDSAPSAVCTGAEVEMVCPGGDVGFVSRIIDESLVLRDKVEWYSSMLHSLNSVRSIVSKLKGLEIGNYAVTELQAGRATKRWAIAWSFGDFRPKNPRHGELVHDVLPPPTAQSIKAPGVKNLGDKINNTLSSLDLDWRWKPSITTGLAMAKGNVWSRAARRQKKQQAQSNGPSKLSDDEEEEVALAAKVTVEGEDIEVRWLRGTDFVLFTSFCGMLKTALGGVMVGLSHDARVAKRA